MGQAVILKFLERYKRSKGFRQKPWISARDIYCRLRKTRNAVGLTSVTQSLRKLRNMGMIRYKELPMGKGIKTAKHYQAR